MSEVLRLLADFRRRGTQIWAEGAQLRFRVASGSLTATEVGQLRQHKAAILALLAQVSTVPVTSFPPIEPVDRERPLPLSYAQQRLWLLAQGHGGSEAYHIPLNFRLRGKLDEAALRRALDQLVRRHETLRTEFDVIAGEPVQRIGPITSGFNLQMHDLSAAAESEALSARYESEEIRAPFDLTCQSSARGRLIRLKSDEHVLLITLHHINADGWSMAVLARELSVLYAGFVAGKGALLEPPPIQYADYAAWQRRYCNAAVLEQRSAYWRETLANSPVLLELPTDRRRPDQQDFKGAWVPIEWDEHFTAGLRQLCRHRGVTLFMSLLTAWAVVLYRLSGQEDLVIGAPSANRRVPEVEALVGFFVNTLPLRMRLSAEQTFEQLLLRSREVVTGAQDNQDVPFEQIVELINPIRSAAWSPLAQVMLAWQNNDIGSLELPGLRAEPLFAPVTTAKVDLAWELGELSGRIVGGLNYATSLFDAATAERHVGYLRQVLLTMIADTRQSIGTVSLSSELERRRLLVEWNATAAPYPEDVGVHQLFESQVRRTPQATAVIGLDRTLTYEELDTRAGQLAASLRAWGAGPGQLVGIYAERGVSWVTALLGVLKSGAAYLPLDPTYPIQRVAALLHEAAPLILLTQAGLRADLPETTAQVIELESLLSTFAEGASPGMGTPGIRVNALSQAYVIYTSGSTGEPKGIAMSHRSLVNLVEWHRAQLSQGEGQRTLQFAALGFDVAFQETLTTLCMGATLVLMEERDRRDPAALIQLLRHWEINRLFIPPMMLQALAEYCRNEEILPDSLRDVIVAGEALRISSHISRLFERLGTCRLHNHYGPTETHLATAITLPTQVHEWESLPPIGRPVSNTQLYLLDAAFEPVPQGATGEIYIGGAGLARGYWKRPGHTAERFIASPFAPGERLYRTGDLGRYRNDGRIEFLGRNDFQIKLRGFRIELGEIESCLVRYSGIRESVVLARDDESGNKRLVAYYTTAQGDGDLDTQALREHLSAELPEYMVPAAYVRLSVLPLTAHGKLDRKALPAPDDTAYGERTPVAPIGDVEIALAQIWAEILGVSQISRHDNFFDLGGHSLLAVRVIFKIRPDLDVDAALNDLFAHPTLAGFARCLEQRGAQILPPLTPVSRDAPLVSSFGQRRLWFLAQLDGVSAAYNTPVELRLRGELHRTALRWALDRLVARHEILRTTFISEQGEIYQRVGAEASGFALDESDLTGRSDGPEQVPAAIRAQSETPFDLEKGPLIRGQLLRTEADEHILLITLHHIISDGWSIEILTREVSALYAARLRDQPDPLPPLKLQYADYAAWQCRWMSGEVLSRHSQWWHTELADAPATLSLPTDHPRPPFQSFNGASVEVILDEAMTGELKALAQRYNMTLFMIVLGAWSLVLRRLSGQDDFVIGVPTANRIRSELEGLIGFFVNMLALRIRVPGEPTVEQWLEQIKAVVLGAQEHQNLPFEQVVDLVRPARSLAYSPVFQVALAWQNNRKGTVVFPGLTVEGISVPNTVAKFDLTLALGESEGRIVGELEFSTALFERATIERYRDYLRCALSRMSRYLSAPVSRVPLLSLEERHRLLVTWNQTAAAFPEALCAHQLFEQQVERDPSAIAVSFADRRLTYGELNTAANRLARHLRSLGVAADGRVAVCMERSLEMVIGLLGTLKAGGIYVPLDPEYPPERLRFMLVDSSPSVILIHVPTLPLLREVPATPGDAFPIVQLDGDAPSWAGEAGDNLPGASAQPTCLACILYTSDSTGTPKGVMVEHRSLVNLLCWSQQVCPLQSRDALLQKTPVGFDASVRELLWPLSIGARLVMAQPGRHRDPEYLISIIRAAEVTIAQFVPALLQSFLEHENVSSTTTLRAVFCGGDELTDPLIGQFHQRLGHARLLNVYGPTEATVDVTACTYDPEGPQKAGAPSCIGHPISNVRLYLLDDALEVVPQGASGEIYVGGVCLARGYWRRPGLTAERFIASPFAAAERLYKTGDLGRYRSDGQIEFLGRNDFQVKLRGLRIKLGEIESCLVRYPGVREAVVLARQDVAEDTRLVAYYTTLGEDVTLNAQILREHLESRLPEYMVPAAYVRLRALPLTVHGKLDRKAFPWPDESAYATRVYEAPRGAVEPILAGVWAEVLGASRISRHDNFFDLGGHSLMAIKVLERLQHAGLCSDIRDLFSAPTLAALATRIQSENKASARPSVPENRIPAAATRILPKHLPLLSLTEAQIGKVVEAVRGGVANVQDIYPLAPLQAGLLFHHLIAREGDPYLLCSLMSFADRGRLDAYAAALQRVISRHDTLRTAFVWEGPLDPVQVVWRDARLIVEELILDPQAGDISEQLRARFSPRHYRLDIRQAPLIRLFAAYDPLHHRWVALELTHHLLADGTSLHILHSEVRSCLLDQMSLLSDPLPFRNLVVQTLTSVNEEDHAAFFRTMLQGVTKATAPFGQLDVHGDGTDTEESWFQVDVPLARRLRLVARSLRVSAASVVHVAYGQVLSQVCELDDVVFGTVMFGRTHGVAGAERALGLFMNTLPVRIRFGTIGIEQCVRATHALLAQLQYHEHAQLASSQRCGTAVPRPLFTTLLNYRHTMPRVTEDAEHLTAWSGIERLWSEERTNYPLATFVDDAGEDFWITVQARSPICAQSVGRMLHQRLSLLVDSLELAPQSPARVIDAIADAGDKMSHNETPSSEPPEGPLESGLAAIWSEVLGLERIGRYDDFFELGGDSLLLLRVVALIQRRLGYEIPVRSAFEARCPAALAASLVDQGVIK